MSICNIQTGIMFSLIYTSVIWNLETHIHITMIRWSGKKWTNMEINKIWTQICISIFFHLLCDDMNFKWWIIKTSDYDFMTILYISKQTFPLLTIFFNNSFFKISGIVYQLANKLPSNHIFLTTKNFKKESQALQTTCSQHYHKLSFTIFCSILELK